MNREEKLLTEAAEWWRNYQAEQNPANSRINVFDILGVSYKEVLMCRMLANLITDTKAHPHAVEYRRSFVQKVLGIDHVPDHFIEMASVETEYLIPGTDRRIDIVIYTREFFIPVEVKIYADDQDFQCYDYYHYAENWNQNRGENTCIYYLTRQGTAPSPGSISKKEDNGDIRYLTPDNYHLISWQKDIVKWLEDIVQEMDTGAEKEITIQFWEAIKEMSGVHSDEEVKYMVDLLTRDEDTFRAAARIEQNLLSAKSAVAERFMKEMDEAMEPVIEQFHLLRSPSRIYPCTDFQFVTDSHFLKYIVTRKNKATGEYEIVEPLPGKQLWFVIEIYWRLDVGFVLYDVATDSIPKIAKTLKGKVDDYLNVPNVNRTYDDWWILFDYLKQQTEVPNFRELNEEALQMADPEKRTAFIKDYIERIQEALKVYLK